MRKIRKLEKKHSRTVIGLVSVSELMEALIDCWHFVYIWFSRIIRSEV